MDTISFRLTGSNTHRFKIKKSTLAKILIIVEIIGITIMAWYLREPLYKKYLAVKPKAYSVQAMDPQKRYLVSENDFLVGKAPPNTKMKLIFNPGRYKRTVRVSDKGNWVAQVPKILDFKPYRLTLANFDQKNNLTSLESFKTRIQSESVVLQSTPYKKIIRPLLPKDLRAQSSLIQTSEFRSWLEEMQKLGIYPYCEVNTEPASECPEDSLIILTDKTGYSQYCSRYNSCFKGENSAEQIQPIVPVVIARAIQNGNSIPYISSVASLIDNLVTPPTKIRINDDTLSDNTVTALNDEESTLLKAQDTDLKDWSLYVDFTNEPNDDR